MANISHFTQTVNGVSTTYDIHDADAIPRSGGAVISGFYIGRIDNSGEFSVYGGSAWSNGGFVRFLGDNHSNVVMRGTVILVAEKSGTGHSLTLYPDGTLAWDGQPIQYVSDQRLKQQINQIDDKLLDAWSDVDLVQFKYNDAVNEKGKDKARLHTGYVVQQIDSACKKHGVDVSQYGLYCHEEYPQETEEVEVEQADGTKVKETKVIREASEHYSLRYTEVYAVECMYLRRCIKQLTARIEELEKGIIPNDNLKKLE